MRLVGAVPKTPGAWFDPERERMWMNAEYVVIETFRETAGDGVLPDGWTHLSIRRADREPIHDWRDLQAIKNAVCGAERDAIEVYPAQSRVVDGANQFHLWVLPEGVRVGVGWQEGSLVDHDEIPDIALGAKQRPFVESVGWSR